jgi:hypothetical protein
MSGKEVTEWHLETSSISSGGDLSWSTSWVVTYFSLARFGLGPPLVYQFNMFIWTQAEELIAWGVWLRGLSHVSQIRNRSTGQDIGYYLWSSKRRYRLQKLTPLEERNGLRLSNTVFWVLMPCRTEKACFCCFVLGSLFDPKDWGDMLLRHGEITSNYTTLQPRRTCSTVLPPW